MTQTSEGTGSGSVDRFLPKIVNGIAKTNNVPDLLKLKEKVQESYVSFYVAKNGSDRNSGTITHPFLTIQKAVDYAESNLESGLSYVININPGFYAETVTLTRAKAHLRGTHEYCDMTMFSSVSKIVINCIEDMDGVNNTQYAISGLLVAPSSGNCITIGGNVSCTTIIKDCNLYADNNGQKCLVNTNNQSIKIKCNSVVFNNKLANANSIEISKGWLDVQRSFIYNGSSSAINFSGETLTIDGVLMQGSGTKVLEGSGSGELNISNSLLESSANNANGIDLSGTVTCSIVQNVFRIHNGTGYSVNGVAGVILIHSLNTFLPTYNNKFKSSMTIVPASTSPVPTA